MSGDVLKEQINCFHFNLISHITFLSLDEVTVEMNKIILTSEDGEDVEEISLNHALYELRKDDGHLIVDIFIPDNEGEIMSYLDEDYELSYDINVSMYNPLETSLGGVFEEVEKYIEKEVKDTIKSAFSFIKDFQQNESTEYLSTLFDIISQDEETADIINIIADL